MGLLTLRDLIFTYVRRLREFQDEVRRTHKTMGSFLDHIRGFIHITFSIGLVPGAAWSYWTFGTCCTSAILSTILLLLVLFHLLYLLFVSLQCEGVTPKIWVRADRGKESVFEVDNLSAEDIIGKINELQ
jgi:hypothetical protein